MSNKLTVYTTSTCVYCKKLKEYLSNKGVEYEEINLETNPDKIPYVRDELGAQGVPVVEYGENVIVGYDPAAIDALLSNESESTSSTGSANNEDVPIIYSTPTCPYCVKLKTYLDENGIRYKDIDISADPVARADIMNRSGAMGVPILEYKGNFIIGFNRPEIDRLLGIQ